jgi:hypothetical protein
MASFRVEGGHRLIVEAHQAPGTFDQPFAIGGEAACPSVAHEQGTAQKLLQPLHLHGDGGLGLGHLFRGTGKAARIRNGEEGLEQVDVEVGDHGGPSITDLDD